MISAIFIANYSVRRKGENKAINFPDDKWETEIRNSNTAGTETFDCLCAF